MVQIADEVAAILRSLTVVDTDCERLVFGIRSSVEELVMVATEDELDQLLGYVAFEANHETNRPRRKRLDAAFAALSEALDDFDSLSSDDTETAPNLIDLAGGGDNRSRTSPGSELAGRWRIEQMDLWERDDLDLVGPAFIEFDSDGTGRFGFIVVSAAMDCRPAVIEERPALEFTWHGFDEGTEVGGRGFSVLGADGRLRGHIFFHMGDDSGFIATRQSADPLGRK
jgi:hypothetical protein